MLVANWKEVLLKSWTVWSAAAGLALPELLELLLANMDVLPLTDEWKSYVRVAALALVILLRPVQQKSLHRDSQPPQGGKP